MAIERVAQNVDFGSAPQAGAVPINVQNAPLDVNKFADNSTSKPTTPSFLDGLVTAVLPAVNKLAEQELTTNREEAYLRGQAAAGAGLAQEQVSSNIFTKDWATAGYRDTRARLAQADAEAQTAVDMPKLREQSPEEFQSYLAERRQKLMSSLEGMSLPARKSFLAQQLTSDRAAIAKHAGEHQKFIIDQLATAAQTDLSVRFDAMTAAKTDPAAYLTAGDNAYAGLYGNIWNNPNFTKDVKVKMTGEAATLALAQNHQLLYEKMRDEKLPGSNTTMLEQLPFDEQVKLGKAYTTSLNDTAAFRLNDYMTQRGLMEASWSDPLKPAMSFQDVKAFVDQGVQIGAVKSNEIDGIYKSWATANEQKLSNAGLAADYAVGNQQGMFARGKQESDGYTAYIQTAARNGKSVADTTASLLQIGLTTGQGSAFKGVGELTRSAVTSIGQTGTIDPSQLQMLNTVLSTLDQAEQKGNKTAMSAYLGAFGPDERAKIMTYREELQRTGNPNIAATNAAAIAEKSSQLTETEKNVLAANHAKSNLDIVNGIEPRGLWGGIVNSVVPDFMRSHNALNTDKITTGKAWFENQDRVEQAIGQSKAAVLEELNYISRSNPYASDDTRKKLALAAVADRTLVLDGGPLVLPHRPNGSTIQDYFGVASNIRPDTISSAINDLHTPAKGNRVIYKIDGQSQLQWQELNASGAFVKGGTMDPRSISGAVQDKQDSITEKFQATDGAGVTMKGATGVSVQFNGNNTAGVQNTDMLEFRKSLVKHESVTDKPYEDLSGKVVNGKKVQTVGVGVSSHNPHFPPIEPDGTVKQEAINQSFIRASNDAAVSARSAQQRMGLPNSNAFKLLAEMSYQGGGAFYNVPDNKAYVEALTEHNVDRALVALKDTVPYKMSGEDRRKYYEDLTRKALGGGAVQTAANTRPNPF